MFRLTRKVFTDLAIWMIAFGLLIGIILPHFIVYMGASEKLLTPWFIASCVLSGFVVGAGNFLLARAVVGKRVESLAERMRRVEKHLREDTRKEGESATPPRDCFATVDSDDEMGDIARAFNRLVEALISSLDMEAAVRAFTETLASQLELDTLTQQALQQLIRQAGADAGAILVEKDGELTVAAAQGIRDPQVVSESDHVRRALRTGKRQVVLLPEDIHLDSVVTDFLPRAVLVEPIIYKQVPLGAIVLASVRNFSDTALARLDLFGQGMGLALNNALAHDRLQRLAALDPLTSVYNRRFGMARLREEFGRAVRMNMPLGILIFDIDHFKEVNDTYGHLVGDRVLTRVAQVARGVIREGDILLRYGGEEFLAVLPAAATADVTMLAERIRRIIEETSFIDGDQTLHVTISLGAAAYPETDITDEQDLIRSADKALYHAKQTGRNRVVTVGVG